MNVGLVLSGGFAKGAYQIGVLKALEEFVPAEEIKYYSCSSIGVLNGYAFATGKLKKAEEMWRGFCNKDNRIFINRILRSSILQQNITKIYDPETPLNSNFYCSLLNLRNRNIVYKDLSSVKDATLPAYMKASVAVPVFNHPVVINDESYYDGAFIDNIPVFPLVKHNIDYVICVYFDDTCYKFEDSYFDNKVIKIIFPGEGLIKNSLSISKEEVESMIEHGYNKGKFILKSIFAEGTDNLDFIYNAIEFLNKKEKKGSFRLTVDVLGTNLNKITKKLTRRKIIR